MAQPMPADNTFLHFPWGPLQMECDARDLIVEGEIPADLQGSLYRNGPNQRFSPRGEYHLFAGDGMVHAFHIANGKVDYRNRWVRTAKWKIEDREGKAVVNAMNPFDCEPEYSDFVLVDKEGLANTALVWHGGRLLAMEEGHAPYELDPQTLDSIGSWTFRGKLHTAMTAHPKVDPATGEMVFFAYMATGPFAADVMVHKVNAAGVLTESIHIPTPYSSMVHDFVITEHYAVFFESPAVFDLKALFSGHDPMSWQPDNGTRVWIVPRGGSSTDVRWFEIDPCYVFHPLNAYDAPDGTVVIDLCRYDDLMVNDRLGPFTEAPPTLDRWVIDPEARKVTETRIDDRPQEFPRHNPRVGLKQHRYGYTSEVKYGEANLHGAGEARRHA